ncbi:MAG: hypothetical protein GC152_10940 [Alphaproteobacteria bacterium]|nr:hypothetical protein [Alphaproteobacteria bacterium]
MRLFSLIFFLFFLVAVTWPGFELVNRPTPIVLGLPFNLFAIAILVLAGMAVLFALYLSDKD